MNVDREQESLARTFWQIQGITYRFGEKRGPSHHANMGSTSAAYYPDGYTPRTTIRVGKDQLTISKWHFENRISYTPDGKLTEQIKGVLFRYSLKAR